MNRNNYFYIAMCLLLLSSACTSNDKLYKNAILKCEQDFQTNIKKCKADKDNESICILIANRQQNMCQFSAGFSYGR